jgi:hypothetical protein
MENEIGGHVATMGEMKKYLYSENLKGIHYSEA